MNWKGTRLINEIKLNHMLARAAHVDADYHDIRDELFVENKTGMQITWDRLLNKERDFIRVIYGKPLDDMDEPEMVKALEMLLYTKYHLQSEEYREDDEDAEIQRFNRE